MICSQEAGKHQQNNEEDMKVRTVKTSHVKPKQAEVKIKVKVKTQMKPAEAKRLVSSLGRKTKR